MTTVDQHGNSFPEKKLEEMQTSDKALYGALPKVFDALKSITPQRVAALFKSAEEGDLVGQHALFSEMEEKDAHLFTEISKRKRAVLAIEWQVSEPENASAAEKKAAKDVQAMLKNLMDFEDLCFDLLDGIGHGFANVELSWARVNKEWRVSEFNHRPHGWFTTDEETRSKFLLKTSTGTVEPLQPCGWISHVHKAKSGYVARSGLYRVLVWPYMFKHFSIGDWAEFLETYGLPVRVGKYPVGATAEEKRTLFAAVQALGRNASAIMPESMIIDFQQVAGGASKSSDPFKEMAAWADKAISTAILGGTLTTQADGKTSTNALGVVHNEVRRELVKADAKQLAGTLTRDLIYPWLVLNGYQIDYLRCPRFEFDLVDTADVTVWADALDKLVGVGLKIKTSWVHEELGIPIAGEGDEVLSREPKVEAVPDKKATQKAQLAAYLKPKAKPAPLSQLLSADKPQALMQAVNHMLVPVVEAVAAGASPDEAIDVLLEQYPTMNSEAVQAALAQAFFVADLWAQVQPDAVE